MQKSPIILILSTQVPKSALSVLTVRFRQGTLLGMPNPKYEPEQFRDIAESLLGEQLWAFLNEEPNVQRMILASEFRATAVDGVAEPLEEKFGSEIAPDRVKQCIGHMIRQILGARGLQIDAQGVRVRQGTNFSKATRYKLSGAEMLQKLKQDLEAIRAKGESGGRPAVEDDLKAALDLWTSARVVHPHLKDRLETVLNTHERLAPTLRVRMLRAG